MHSCVWKNAVAEGEYSAGTLNTFVSSAHRDTYGPGDQLQMESEADCLGLHFTMSFDGNCQQIRTTFTRRGGVRHTRRAMSPKQEVRGEI